MSLDKAIMHGKEHRKEYLGPEAFDPTCCNHGSCNVVEIIAFIQEKNRIRRKRLN